MTKNEILQKLKQIEKLDKEQIEEIFALGEYPIPKKRIQGYLASKEEKHFLDCGAQALGHFLDGLIYYKRGHLEKKENNQVVALTNNLILKKLRIAYELKESDLFAIFHSVDIDITKGELSSLFRNENHKKFRFCPDSILELFLEGLALYVKET